MLRSTFGRSLAVLLTVITTLLITPALAQPGTRSAYAQAVPAEGLEQLSPVEKLLAIEEIRGLSLRYGRCISQKDWTCVRALFTPNFRMNGHPFNPDGFIDVMRQVGAYDRVVAVLNVHGAEIEILSPKTARGIVAADFTFYFPPDSPYRATGTEIVAPGQQMHTETYYYHTYEKVDEGWKIKTLDHVEADLRTKFSGHTKVFKDAYTTPDGVIPVER